MMRPTDCFDARLYWDAQDETGTPVRVEYLFYPASRGGRFEPPCPREIELVSVAGAAGEQLIRKLSPEALSFLEDEAERHMENQNG